MSIRNIPQYQTKLSAIKSRIKSRIDRRFEKTKEDTGYIVRQDILDIITFIRSKRPESTESDIRNILTDLMNGERLTQEDKDRILDDIKSYL